MGNLENFKMYKHKVIHYKCLIVDGCKVRAELIKKLKNKNLLLACRGREDVANKCFDYIWHGWEYFIKRTEKYIKQILAVSNILNLAIDMALVLFNNSENFKLTVIFKNVILFL